jgi:hypothetical protein
MASIQQPIDRVFARSRAAVAATMFLVATVSVSVWSGRAFSDDNAEPQRLVATALRPVPLADPSAGSSAASTGRMEGGQTGGRWREGTRMIDEIGSFRHAGDRVTFVSADGKLKFDCLENLCMERVGRVIGDSPDVLQWSASGVITECAGTNYLLLSQAALKAPPSRHSRLP